MHDAGLAGTLAELLLAELAQEARGFVVEAVVVEEDADIFPRLALGLGLAHQILQLRDLSNPATNVKVNWTLSNAGSVANAIPADAKAIEAAGSDEALEKLKKTGNGPPGLTLAENPDILATIARSAQRPRIVVGFAAETEKVAEHATQKLTKKGCDLGDCGACTVVLEEPCEDGATRVRAVNSCILLLPMVDGRRVWTVEGIGTAPRFTLRGADGAALIKEALGAGPALDHEGALGLVIERIRAHLGGDRVVAVGEVQVHRALEELGRAVAPRPADDSLEPGRVARDGAGVDHQQSTAAFQKSLEVRAILGVGDVARFLRVQYRFHRSIDALYANPALDALLPDLGERGLQVRIDERRIGHGTSP